MSVIKFERYIQELICSDCAEDDFLQIKPIYFYFIVIWIDYNCYQTHQSLVFQPTFYKFIVLCYLGLDRFNFWDQDSNCVLTQIINIYPKNRRTSQHVQRACLEASNIIIICFTVFYTSHEINFFLIIYYLMP